MVMTQCRSCRRVLKADEELSSWLLTTEGDSFTPHFETCGALRVFGSMAEAL